MDSTGAIILAISLFIIMLGMGLSLTTNDFKRVVKYPKAVVTGLINQIILLPILAYILVKLMVVSPEIAVGIMILAACPGGPTSNLIAYLSKGDAALSVTLTAISSLITIVTIPLIVQFALNNILGQDTLVALDVPKIIIQLLVIIVIPVSIGMYIRIKTPAFANKMEKPVKIASGIVLALVIAGILVKEKANIANYFEQAGIIALVLNVGTMLLGLLTAWILKLTRPQAITIAIETGIQNGTLAIAIATITLGSTELAISGAIYSLIMFFTGFVAIALGNKAHVNE